MLGVNLCIIGRHMNIFYESLIFKLPTIQFFVPTIQKLILQWFFFQIFVLLLIKGYAFHFIDGCY